MYEIKCTTCQSRLKSIFSDQNPSIVDELERIKICQHYKKGEIIFQEGSYPRGLFCIYTGKIKVVQKGVDGREQILHLINAGDVMAHRAIFANDTFSCSAIAMEDTQICFIPRKPFYELAEKNAKLALKFAHLLADELKEAETKVTHTAMRSVKSRIAEALIILKDNYGLESDEQTLSITIKREELANLAGTTRETATRFLYEFQRSGFIEIKEKKIKIINLKELSILALEE